MRVGCLSIVPASVLAVVLSQAACAPPPPALSGRVTSAADGPMEGVLVSAKRVGSTMTTTVVTDKEGRYQFPARRLAPGRYYLFTRAVRYDLDGPDAATIPPGGAAVADLRLRPAHDLAG